MYRWIAKRCMSDNKVALLVQAELKDWEAAEAAKKALQKQIMEQLKADRAAQLAERNLVIRIFTRASLCMDCSCCLHDCCGVAVAVAVGEQLSCPQH